MSRFLFMVFYKARTILERISLKTMYSYRVYGVLSSTNSLFNKVKSPISVYTWDVCVCVCVKM